MPNTSRPTSSARMIASSSSPRCFAGSTARSATGSTVAAMKLSTPISICSWFICLRCDTLLQEACEGRADAQENDDPEHRYDHRQKQTAWSHQHVKEQNVNDDGRE